MGSVFQVNELKLDIPLDEIYGGTGTNTYTTGDLLYASNSTTLSKRNIGATGQILTSDGSVPVYSTITPTNGATGATGSTGATGNIPTNASFYGRIIGSQTINNNFDAVFINPPQHITTGLTYSVSAAAPNGNAFVTVANAGNYLVAFGYFSTNTGAVVMGLSVNNAAPTANYRLGIGVGDRFVITRTSCIMSLNAGDTLRLKNVSGINFAISSPVGTNLSCFLTIVKLT